MTRRTNHGPCKRCGAPVLYQGAEFCSPDCQGKGFLEFLLVDRPEARPPAGVPVHTEEGATEEQQRCCVLCGDASQHRVCVACKSGEMDDS